MLTACSDISRVAAGKERDISTLSGRRLVFPDSSGKAEGTPPGVSKVTPTSLHRHLLLGE